MSIYKIHLRKLLKAFDETPNQKTSLLRADIRNEIKKQKGENSGGGDFHGPFWSDAKNHASGITDLSIATLERIAMKESRGRLYPELSNGFLEWWEKKRRSRNESISAFPYSVNKHFEIGSLNSTVKVENLLSINIGGDMGAPMSQRLIYPYFSEDPTLSSQSARLGLWLLTKALPEYNPEYLRILDVIRARAFSLDDLPLQGDEEQIFVTKYASLISDWEKLYQEYA